MTVPNQPIQIPANLQTLAKLYRKRITFVDPGIAIAFNEEGLRTHHPHHNAKEAKAEIAAAILNSGMQAADGETGMEFFTGRASEALAAQDAVHAIPWTRHEEGVADIGHFFFVYPRGASSVEFAISQLMFNA